ncbi:MAG: ABC transporter permease, partial [Chloroflexi bacterium]|nr:ABC transporter permease [Chloroflexota bacterium]
MMSRLWLVARHEYRVRVLQRGFIWVILSVPLLMAFTLGLIALTDMMRYNSKPVGYVDQGGWLVEPVYTASENKSLLDIFSKKPVTFIPYATEEAAGKALESGDLQAYYVLPADYLQSRQMQLVYLRAPGQNATQQFRRFIQDNLLAQQSPEVARRASEGTFLTVRTPDNTREYREKAPINLILPLLLSMAFMILLATSSMTLMEAVVQDKENRIVEVLTTSVSPGQLIGGKVLAIVAMGFTQLVAWA